MFIVIHQLLQQYVGDRRRNPLPQRQIDLLYFLTLLCATPTLVSRYPAEQQLTYRCPSALGSLPRRAGLMTWLVTVSSQIRYDDMYACTVCM